VYKSKFRGLIRAYTSNSVRSEYKQLTLRVGNAPYLARRVGERRSGHTSSTEKGPVALPAKGPAVAARKERERCEGGEREE
jgi:hypothetical protein